MHVIKKIVLVLVRSVKLLSNATIPFEDRMKNSDDAQKRYLVGRARGEGLLTYVNNNTINRNESSNVIFQAMIMMA